MTASDHMSWVSRAACRGLDPELFHPGPGESPAPARAVCGSCPVRVECGQWALFDRVQHHGIWGGLTERDRRRIRRAHRRTTTTAAVVSEVGA